MKQVFLYTDGSALGNPGPGGYCGILVYNGVEKIIQGREKFSTNNRMELMAVNESLKVLKEPCRIMLYTDSKYVCDGISKWIQLWIKKDFKNIKNIDLWKEYLSLITPHFIETHWIKGHNGHMMNEKCDKIAKMQAYSLN